MVGDVPTSQNGAIYFPYLKTTDPVSGLSTSVAPSGYVAGIFATTDSTRGVWKAPAGIGTRVIGTTGPVATGVMNDMQQGVLNSPTSPHYPSQLPAQLLGHHRRLWRSHSRWDKPSVRSIQVRSRAPHDLSSSSKRSYRNLTWVAPRTPTTSLSGSPSA